MQLKGFCNDRSPGGRQCDLSGTGRAELGFDVDEFIAFEFFPPFLRNGIAAGDNACCFRSVGAARCERSECRAGAARGSCLSELARPGAHRRRQCGGWSSRSGPSLPAARRCAEEQHREERLEDIAAIIHAHPTQSETLMEAARNRLGSFAAESAVSHPYATHAVGDRAKV